MASRRILTIDNAADLAVLKQVSAPVERVDDTLRALMDEMLETMYAAPGIGLAAVQVGEPVRVIVMDLGDREATPDTEEQAAAVRRPAYYVNPEIIWSSDETAPYEEGCLSVPEIYEEVDRPARVKLRYLNSQGEQVEEEADGLFAVCIQHEMDHLQGVLFIDHLSRLKRDRSIAKVKKAAKAA